MSVAAFPAIPARSEARPRVAVAVCVGLLLASALAGRLVYLTRPFNSDASMFIEMGKVISDGGVIGIDFCDNKFPTVGLVTSIAWRSFGTWWAGYVLTQTAMMLLAAGMLARVLRRHVGDGAALAAGCFALVLLNLTTLVFGGFQLETMQVFFAVLAAAAGIEALYLGTLSDAVVAGMCAGCAAMLKPTGLAVAGALMLAMILSQSATRARLRQIAGVIAGILIPACVSAICLMLNGSLRELPEIWHQITRYAGQSAWEICDLYKVIVVGLLIGFPMLIRGWVFRRDAIPGRGGSHTRPTVSQVGPRTASTWIFALAWLILELLGVILQRRMYAYHFLVLIPPAAILFAMIRRRTTARSLLAALLPVMLLSVLGARRAADWNYRGQRLHPVSAYLLAHARQGDAIWREDGARILLETGLHAGSRYPLTFLFTNYDQAPIDYGRVILDDFARTRPAYIVLFTNFDDWIGHQCGYYTELRRRPVRRANYIRAWGAIRAYVDGHYTPAAIVGDETIYRRSD